MKKTILFLILNLILATVSINAQNDISFGIQAGANYSRYTPKFPFPDAKDVSYTGKIGYYFGGFLNFKIDEQLRIQPSILFASQGSALLSENVEVRLDINSPAIALDFKTNIIESTIVFPIVVQNYLGEKFYIEAGPQIGYIFSRKAKSVGDTFPGETNEEASGDLPNTDKLDFGLLVGFGYKLSENFSLNSRYFFGVTKRTDDNLKSSVLNIGIEYSFNRR